MDRIYRLLIVDDERHVVEWLGELFEEQEDIRLEIYKAQFAREALDILGRVKIDIVLSDIKMPGMDGFELADRIIDNWPQAKIIFLTGYGEFEYAYKANRYKNISFLLKTEDDDAILQAVKSASLMLEEEIRQLELARDYTSIREVIFWQMQKNILAHWIEKKAVIENGYQSEEELYFPFQFQKKTALLCIRVEEAPLSLWEQEKFAAALQKLLQEMLFQKGDIGIINMDAIHYMALVQPRSEGDIMLFLREMLDEFAAAVLEGLGCYAFFTMYETMVAFETIKEHFEVLKLALQDVADTGNLYGGRILGREEEYKLLCANELRLQDKLLKQKLERMSVLLTQGKREEFFVLFQEIYDRIVPVTSRHYYPAIEIFQYFSVMFLSWINRKNLVEKLAFKTALVKLMNLSDFIDWREAFDYLRDLGTLLFLEQREEQEGKNSAFIQSIQQFVKDNLSSDLSLTYIAQRLHYNPSYISRLFKQISGKNLSEYILEEKMAYAKRRLMESEDTVAVIAQEVGFDSSQYFSVVFKKQAGMTPGEYRHSKVE